MSDVTRRDAVKLAAAGAVLAVGATTARAKDDKVSAAVGQDWDCVMNMTGKNLLITLASGNAGGPGYYVPKDGKLPFRVRKTTKRMAYVAYEFGTDNLVRMEEFEVVHQPYPPTDCLHITANAAAQRVKRAAAAAGEAEPLAAPPPY